MKKLLVRTLLLISLTTAAQAVIWNTNVTEEEVLEKAQEISSVVQLLAQTGGGSGTIIARNEGKIYILTAKHVVDNKELIYAILDLGNGVKKAIQAKGYYTNPNGTPLLEQLKDSLELITGGVIAILELEEDMDTRRKGLTIAPLYQDTPESLSSAILHGAGYGIFGSNNETTLSASDGQKRYYETSILEIEEDFSNQFASRTPITYEATLWSSAMQSMIAYNVQKLSALIHSGALTNYFNIFPSAWAIGQIITIAIIEDSILAWTSPSSTLIKTKNVQKYPYQREDPKFYGSIESGDSGSPIFEESGQIVAIARSVSIKHNDFTVVYPYLAWIEQVLNGEKKITLLNPNIAPNYSMKIRLLASGASTFPHPIELNHEILYSLAYRGGRPSKAILDTLSQHELDTTLYFTCYYREEKAQEKLIEWGARIDARTLCTLAIDKNKPSQAVLNSLSKSVITEALSTLHKGVYLDAEETLLSWIDEAGQDLE